MIKFKDLKNNFSYIQEQLKRLGGVGISLPKRGPMPDLSPGAICIKNTLPPDHGETPAMVIPKNRPELLLPISFTKRLIRAWGVLTGRYTALWLHPPMDDYGYGINRLNLQVPTTPQKLPGTE